MKVYGVTGWENSGKTGLMERLIAGFTERGLRVSTIKHAHHVFDVDHPGRDSWRHRQAGAGEVLVSSGTRWALMHELRGETEPTLAELLARLAPADLVLIEGFKMDNHPKIECFRKVAGHELRAPEDPTIHAIAADCDLDATVPVFALDDTTAILDFIATEVGL